jgi:hypothetical protein
VDQQDAVSCRRAWGWEELGADRNSGDCDIISFFHASVKAFLFSRLHGIAMFLQVELLSRKIVCKYIVPHIALIFNLPIYVNPKL